MKTDKEGRQLEVLKTFRNASNTIKVVDKKEVFADLLRVKYSTGKIEVICESQLNN